ncbi:Wall-associated receptor kinase [Actinidia chinensis var. chinensis]|uniref:Wall-associated receptor kinase n=1 Tax=Actinidia chinensis var. chinensis TaxID=1590841 RepID=A0A2R6RNQ7_ACTCC|nr:Wall-associated receptor kinase [Actinidia chinensis var. chinensis]
MAMSLPLIFLQLVLAWLLGAAAMAASQALPGCENRCGNINIPYPFGTREGCYIDNQFLVACNASNNPPKLFLMQSNIEVTDIFVWGALRILSPIGYDCYNAQGGPGDNFIPWMSLNRFPISNTQNKFTAVGCNTYAIVNGVQGRSFTTGCLSFCDSINNVINGSCSGIGCCQTSIPKEVRSFNMTMQSYDNHANVWDFNPCSYAFVAEEAAYNFSSLDLANLQNREKLPVMLDWAVGNETCDEARKNQKSYACKENSECYNFDNGPGYRCNCSEGYEGNPYLSNGCQDIDECMISRPCSMICLNLPGTYNCSCPKGFEGDGRKHGSGCRRIPSKRHPSVNIAIGVCSGIGSLLLIIVAWWLHKVLKKRQELKRKEFFFKRNGGLLFEQQLSSSVEKTKLFKETELDKATDHYNEDRILGRGGQGTVYKGMLSDGRIVAIKKSKVIDEGVEQFINEVVILSQINHRNVVKLLGCCLETDVPQLVYEFISNGTLSQHIHDPNEEFLLSWEMRLEIAIEVAEALSHLHCATSVPIYHRDIKSTNILLDDKFKAKVSDFGTSRSVAVDQTHFTTQVKGTLGYLDPEFFQSSQFTEKSDVYSFGVVLVELLTGQKAISSTSSHESKSLATRFIRSIEDDRLFEILDPKIIKVGRKEEMVAVAQLAQRCLNLKGKKRPFMREVAVVLERIRMSRENSTTQQNYEVVNTTQLMTARRGMLLL